MLLKAGITAMSADCIRTNTSAIHIATERYNLEQYVLSHQEPCWSYDQLLEIIFIFEPDFIIWSKAFDISVLVDHLLFLINEVDDSLSLIKTKYEC